MLGGKNKHRSQPLGYTIVEVMIVLAVSGVMFLIAANFINGKQERAAFIQGSNDLASKLQGLLGDVADGHYSDVPLQCAPNGGSLQASTASSGNQGENANCLFLGKIMGFYDPTNPTSAASTDKNSYHVYSIAVDRSVTTIPNSLVAAISGLTTQSGIPQSLYVKDMTVNGSNAGVYNIGFLQSLDTTGSVSGAQQPVKLAYVNSYPAQDSDVAGLSVRTAQSAVICLSDGTRYAQILIGGSAPGLQSNSANNNQLNISVQQLGTVAC